MEKILVVAIHKIKTHWIDSVALLVLILSIWFPRVLALDYFVSPDENEHLAASANFYYALNHGDFISTYQNDLPGVTTMWAGTAGFLTRFPGYRGSGVGQLKPGKLDLYLTQTAEISPLEILKTSRQFVLLFITIALILAYFCARRLIGLLPAFLAFIAIALDPFHVALSRILHLDGLLSSFLILSLLAYLCFFYDSRLLFLIISATSAGFAFLTRTPGIIIVPVILLITLVYLFYNFRNFGETNPKIRMWKSAWSFLLWCFFILLVIIVFWPAMWVQPVAIIKNLILKSAEHAEIGHDFAIFFNGDIIEDGNLGFKYFYFYPLTFLWRTTPFILSGLVLALWGYVTLRKPFNNPTTRFTSLGLILFISTFTFVITLSEKKFDRYYLPVYPAFDILAGMGWASLGYWFLSQERTQFYKPVIIGGFVILVGLQAFLTLSTSPYYFTYYNPMLGGIKTAQKVMQIGWGEGYDRAGRYLSQKKDAENLKVISWYTDGTLSYFFPGHVRPLNPYIDPNVDQKLFWGSDYAIIYIHNWQRGFPKAVLNLLATRIPEHTISINGIEYIRIYKLR